VSLGTGRTPRRRRPRWLGDWLGWILNEMFRSPGEQQTELTHRHYRAAAFYRIEVELPHDIGLDDTRQIPLLRRLGEGLADQVDWDAILAGEPGPFAVGRAGAGTEPGRPHSTN
jgi:hypothetical protein